MSMVNKKRYAAIVRSYNIVTRTVGSWHNCDYGEPDQ